MTQSGDPLVSVLVPMFNMAGTLERAIDSALAQEGVSIEVIAVDDSSTDDTWAKAQALYGADARVKLLRLDRNGGVAAARNAGLAAAQGAWIALLDADDLWLPGRLTAMLAHADEADLIADDLLAYDGASGEMTGRYFKGRLPVGPISLTCMMEPNPAFDLGFLKPLMRRGFLEEHGLRYHVGLRHGEDLHLYALALCHAGRLIGMDYAGYVYTTPAGRALDAVAAQQSAKDQNAALSQALSEMGRTYATSLSHGERQAVQRRAAYFLYVQDYIVCVMALRQRRPWVALRALFHRPQMLAYAWRVVRFRLLARGAAA